MKTSDTSMPTKADVESLPLGDLRLSILAGSEEWLHEERQTRLLKKVVGLRDELVHSKRAIACATTRLIVFTSDIAEEISRWQLALGIPLRNSSDYFGIVAGKVFTWGNGEPKTTYSVIVLSESLGEHLIGDDAELQMQARGVLAHELAHSHDNFVNAQFIGSAEYETDYIGWDGFQRGMSISLRAETFADAVAGTYYPTTMVDSEVALTVELAKACRSNIRSAILRVQATRDCSGFFGELTSELSKTANQFGRVIGLLTARGDETRVEDLRHRLRDVSNRWLQFFDRAYALLSKNPESGQQQHDVLFSLINYLARANGVIVGDHGFEFDLDS